MSLSPNYYVVYISPNGSTGQVAEALAERLSRGGAAVSLADLAEPAEGRSLAARIAADESPCVLVGSPVYRDLAVPPVMAFIDALIPCKRAWSVPFVTYGRACSGVALWQMATALQQKGFRIAGAAKVAAVHSMMWRTDHPAGEGHPDADALRQVRRLADDLRARFKAGTPGALPLARLDYQPAERALEFKARIGKPWTIVPKTVEAKACTACGICVVACPAGAITLNTLPAFGPTCFDCFSCVRVCPEEAVVPAVPLAKIEAMIRARVKTVNEQPLTCLFLPSR